MVEVVQGCQVHSHNMVPYVCLPGQVELKEQYKYTSARMCITVVLLFNHYCTMVMVKIKDFSWCQYSLYHSCDHKCDVLL